MSKTLDFDALVGGPVAHGPGRVTFGATIQEVSVRGAGGSGRVLLPALCNAHDHGRGLRSTAFGAGDDTLEVWIGKLALEPKVDPYLRAAVAFGRAALGGVGVLNHCHNVQDPNGLLVEAEAVASAAADVGLRVAFATPLMGLNPVTYGDPAPLLAELPAKLAAPLRARADQPPDFARQLEVAEAIFDLASPHFLPQYGPVGPQWVDEATLAIVAERSAATGRRVHMHLLETEAQRRWADAAYPEGLVRRLDALGLLSPRLTVAHGVWLRPDECALLAERGVMVSVNVSSNLRLRSGVAPVKDFVAAGLGFGMGLDGMAFDDDEDALRELRLLWNLHRGFGFERVLSAEGLWRAVVSDGRRAILGPDSGGVVAVGAPADLLALRTDRISADVIPERADVADLVLARATKADVAALYVAGRQVVRDGRVLGLDLPEAEAALLAEARAGAGPIDAAARAALDAAYRRYYGGDVCCARPGEGAA